MTLLSSVIQRDTRANQPAATAVPVGTLYYVTDETVLERSNGTTWDSYSAVGFNITSLTADTLDWAADYIPFYDNGEAANNKVLISNLARERLTANRTYYVRTDGSDSNTGLTDSAGGAFLTIQKAVNVCLQNLDFMGYNVTVQVGTGTFTGAVEVNGPHVSGGSTVAGTTSGKLILKGDTTTPSNVVISTTSATCIKALHGAIVYVEGFKVTAATSGHGVFATNGSTIYVTGKMDFGAFASTQAQVLAVNQSVVNITTDYNITAGFGYHYQALHSSSIYCQSRTITLTGTPAIGSQFANAVYVSALQVNGNTYSGSATGTRYYAALNGVIWTNGGGASYFPGDVAGSTATGGQYA